MKYLDPPELSERWGVPVSTIYQWNYLGRGPRCYKFGRHLRYAIEDIEQWEAERASDFGDAA